jgi:hypothetical protein
VATRFYRWTASGLWQRILSALQEMDDAAGQIDWSVHLYPRRARSVRV